MELDYYDGDLNANETEKPLSNLTNFLNQADAVKESVTTRSSDAALSGELNFDPCGMTDGASSVTSSQRVSREPKDWLRDVGSSDLTQREYALKNLEWQWGIPRRTSEAAVQLGSLDIDERSAAQRRLEHMGCEAIPAVHAVNQWNDAEVNSRCWQLLNYYLDTQPLSELLKFPEILEYLPKDPLFQRLEENIHSPERLNRMAKEVDLLMLVPEVVDQRLRDIESDLFTTINPESRVFLREEHRRLSNLPQLGQEIQTALANATNDPEAKRMHLKRAMEVNPHAAQQLDFLWQCQLNNMLGDEEFERELQTHGALKEWSSAREGRLRDWVLSEDSRSMRTMMLTDFERTQAESRRPMEKLSDHIFWNGIEEHYPLAEAIERKSLASVMSKPWPTILGAHMYRLQQTIKVQDPKNPEIQQIERRLNAIDDWVFPKE